VAREAQPPSQRGRRRGEDRELPSAQAEPVAQRDRAQVGARQAQGRGTSDGLLGAYELADRICRVFGCPHYEHLSIPQEVA